ncbi:hypothetical protein AB0C95_07600 [Streptomyces caniferus]|uniref:hypothetical protein n=1 Tax=Streptomyces caniferus TaxID=285557 RepID=UPI0033D6F2A8
MTAPRSWTRPWKTDFPDQSGPQLFRAVSFIEEALPPEQAGQVLTAGARLSRRHAV